MKERKALKLALEASKDLCTEFALAKVQEILTNALAQPEQEPVDFEALIVDIECIDCRYRGDPSYDRDAYWMRDEVIAAIKRHSSYYTTQPQRTAAVGEDTRRAWVGLTDGEIDEAQDAAEESFHAMNKGLKPRPLSERASYFDWHLARAIEAKLKEKNNGFA